MSTLSVVEQILREAANPMSVKEIVERAGAELPTKSKTPDTVVARDLSMDIKKKGEGSLFVRTSPGRYAMRAQHIATTAETAETANTANTANTTEAESAPTSITKQAVSEGRAPTKPAVHASEQSDQTGSASA